LLQHHTCSSVQQGVRAQHWLAIQCSALAMRVAVLCC
jgi:hypothetical protein